MDSAELLSDYGEDEFRAHLLKLNDDVWAEVHGPFSMGWVSLKVHQLRNLARVLNKLIADLDHTSTSPQPVLVHWKDSMGLMHKDVGYIVDEDSAYFTIAAWFWDRPKGEKFGSLRRISRWGSSIFPLEVKNG